VTWVVLVTVAVTTAVEVDVTELDEPEPVSAPAVLLPDAAVDEAGGAAEAELEAEDGVYEDAVLEPAPAPDKLPPPVWPAGLDAFGEPGADEEVNPEDVPRVSVSLREYVVVTVTMLVEVEGTDEEPAVTPPAVDPLGASEAPLLPLGPPPVTAGTEVETEVRVSGQTVVE
jgi:hypothetical protein